MNGQPYDPGLVITIIAFCVFAPTVVAVIGIIYANHNAQKASVKLETIHVLVNSRLTLALSQLAAVSKKLAVLLPDDEKAQADSVVATANAKKETA